MAKKCCVVRIWKEYSGQIRFFNWPFQIAGWRFGPERALKMHGQFRLHAFFRLIMRFTILSIIQNCKHSFVYVHEKLPLIQETSSDMKLNEAEKHDIFHWDVFLHIHLLYIFHTTKRTELPVYRVGRYLLSRRTDTRVFKKAKDYHHFTPLRTRAIWLILQAVNPKKLAQADQHLGYLQPGWLQNRRPRLFHQTPEIRPTQCSNSKRIMISRKSRRKSQARRFDGSRKSSEDFPRRKPLLR